jgi:glycosyltransferase involved in cell wall biosynthesis
MRILIVNWSSRKVGGIEDYLTNLMPALVRTQHDLAFAHEVDIPDSRDRISLPEGVPCWSVSALGVETALESMKAWKPDLIYAHGLLDPEFEDGFLKMAPAIYFSHNYYGTCISGLKTFKFPTVRPCHRQFGPACLLQYFPRRCGGRSPLTMWKLFRRESRRLANLHKYQAIVTHSNHMREEYVRNGIPESRVHSFVYEVARPHQHASGTRAFLPSRQDILSKRNWNLLFVGRMELLKGGATLIDALPQVADKLGIKIRVTFAGDGPQRNAWERRAEKARARHPELEFQFAGWADKNRLDEIYSETDLLVVPSLWPEPFGRVGPEAGSRGIPVAAFNVGGVSDWLINGVNGYLAPGNPPTAVGLAAAIIKCLEDGDTYRELRKGATTVARQFNLEHHLEALQEVFAQVAPQLVQSSY